MHLFNQIRIQTFLEISPNFYNDWRWNGSVSVYLFQLVKYIPILVTALDIHYFSFYCQKNKLTQEISYSNKALMNIHHDAPNSYVPGINFLEFLVHAFSITSYRSW